MKRIVAFSLVVTLLIAVCASCAGTQKPEALPPALSANAQMAKLAMRATVIVLSPDGNPICAGTFVEEYRMLTAAHCVRPQQSKNSDHSVMFLTYDNWNAGYIVADEGHLTRFSNEDDVAVVVLHKQAPVHVELGEEPAIGDQIFTIGHPELDYYTVAAGTLTVRRVPIHDGEFYKALIAIEGGSSGGGLYDAQWHYIGTTSMMNYGGAIGYFAVLDAVQAILK